MILMLGLGSAVAVLVFIRPRLALWIGLVFPAIQPFYSPSLIRMGVITLCLASLALGWKNTAKRQRQTLVLLWAGVLCTLTIGWLAAPVPSVAQGAVVNLLYAAIVASVTVVYRMKMLEWHLYLMAWGVLTSAWLMSHDIVLTGRTGALFLDENADVLGVLAALGLVSAIGICIGPSRRALRLVVGFPTILICSLGIVASASRGALVVAVAGVAVQAVAPLLRGTRARAFVTLSVLGFVGTWLVVPLLTWFLNKSGRELQAPAGFSDRVQILQSAVTAGLQHPLGGVGFGGVQVSDIGVSSQVSPHNAYVGLLAATGVLPTLLLGILIISAIGRARVYRASNLLPLLVASIAIGLSIDWVPTAKLCTIVLSLLTFCAALDDSPRRDRVPSMPTLTRERTVRGSVGDQRLRRSAGF